MAEADELLGLYLSPDDLLQHLRQKLVPRSYINEATDEILHLNMKIRDLQQQEGSGVGMSTDSIGTDTRLRQEYMYKNELSSAFEPIVSNNFRAHLSPCQQYVDICTTVASKDEVSVLFADVVGFTAMSAAMDASRVADMLRRLFVCLDDLALAHGVQPVDVIGDAYLAAANLDTPCLDHAARLAGFAVAAVAAARTVPVDPASPSSGHLRIRVGLHCGPVAVAVLSRAGAKRSLIGDTVNTASRMESTGRPDQVQCSGEMAHLLAEQAPELALRPRKGGVVAKGKGRLETYWVGPHPLEVAGRQGPGGSFQVTSGHSGGDDGVLVFGGSFRYEGSIGCSFRGSTGGSLRQFGNSFGDSSQSSPSGSFRSNFGGSFHGGVRDSFRASFGRSDSFGGSLRGGIASRASSAATVEVSEAGLHLPIGGACRAGTAAAAAAACRSNGQGFVCGGGGNRGAAEGGDT